MYELVYLWKDEEMMFNMMIFVCFTAQSVKQAVSAGLGAPAGESEYLRSMMGRVPEEMANSVASSTSRGYESHWRRWQQFTVDNGVVSLPAD